MKVQALLPIIVAVAAIGITTDVSAKTPIGHRQTHQARRIDRGVHSGQLTKKETRSLVRDEKAIQHEKRLFKSDGNFTPAERRHVQQDLNQESRKIYAAKHNNAHRPGAPYPTPHPVNPAATPGVTHHQGHQAARITQGVHSGQLTKEEAQELRDQEKAIRQEKKEYKSDGIVTKEERVDLHKDLNDTSRDIYNEKHDDETRS